MKTKLAAAMLVLGLASSCVSSSGGPGGGGGTVQVTFQNPDQFTDMSRTYSGAREADPGYMEEMQQYIEQTGSGRIPAGYTLAVTITDVDMAGNFEPERGPRLTDVRIMRSIYPPRINLSYRLTDPSGAVRIGGEEHLRDLTYDWSISGLDRQDSLRHEKNLLSDFLSRVARSADRAPAASK